MIAPTSFFADYGCHVRIYEEAQILQKLGHRVTIVTYRNGNDVPGLDIRRTLPIPWRQSYEVGSSRHKLGFDLLLGAKTLQLLFQERFDVIHAHLHEGALIGQVLGKLARLPVVFDFQGSLTEEMIDHKFLRRDSFVYKPLRNLERWIDHWSPVILTSSANAQQLLISSFAIDDSRVALLPDCVNADAFRPRETFDAQQLQQLRSDLGIPEQAQLIVYLGLLAEYQGTGLLLRAMQRIIRQEPNVYLLLMGFPGVAYYQQLAQNLGIAERVIFTGKVPYVKAPTCLALGNVAVAPKLSISEGAGKLLNYMATALPTVAFDTPVAREYLGRHGLYAVRGDVTSLAKKLLSALNGGDGMANSGRQLRQRAIQLYSWETAGRQIVSIYERLLGKEAGGELPIELAPTRK
ncbi:MAG: glycosyltransferase family 4 protein [Caldilineaceae bacterium]